VALDQSAYRKGPAAARTAGTFPEAMAASVATTTTAARTSVTKGYTRTPPGTTPWHDTRTAELSRIKSRAARAQPSRPMTASHENGRRDDGQLAQAWVQGHRRWPPPCAVGAELR